MMTDENTISHSFATYKRLYVYEAHYFRVDAI